MIKKNDLIEITASKTGLSKKNCDAVISTMLESITEALAKGEKVQLFGFGSFETKERAAHIGRSPKTCEPMEIPSKRVAVFKSGKALKTAVSEQE